MDVENAPDPFQPGGNAENIDFHLLNFIDFSLLGSRSGPESLVEQLQDRNDVDGLEIVDGFLKTTFSFSENTIIKMVPTHDRNDSVNIYHDDDF